MQLAKCRSSCNLRNATAPFQVSDCIDCRGGTSQSLPACLKGHGVLQVLYLTEPIDEVAIQNLAEYDDKKFVDVSREGIDLGTDDQDTKKVSIADTAVMTPDSLHRHNSHLSFSSAGCPLRPPFEKLLLKLQSRDHFSIYCCNATGVLRLCYVVALWDSAAT